MRVEALILVQRAKEGVLYLLGLLKMMQIVESFLYIRRLVIMQRTFLSIHKVLTSWVLSFNFTLLLYLLLEVV